MNVCYRCFKTRLSTTGAHCKKRFYQPEYNITGDGIMETSSICTPVILLCPMYINESVSPVDIY